MINTNKIDNSALYRIGYGLYVVTTRDGDRDNGCIVNTVMQLTSNPVCIAVAVNKQNYTCELIEKTGILNVNCLGEDTPFEVFRNFGYQSGRDADKLAGYRTERSENGLIILPEYASACLSLAVERTLDLGTHIQFLCSLTEARILSEKDTITYSYYQRIVKPQPKEEKKKGYSCKICGYVYEGDPLPDDFVCPLCKHGAADFEPLA